MEYAKPRHIVNEKDLKFYENYLKNDTVTCKEISLSAPAEAPKRIIPETLTNPVFFQGYLKNHRGKLIKVESVLGDRLESRTGILLEVGNDFLVIKLQRSCLSMMIPGSFIKYITIIHDNDIRKVGTKIR